MNATAAPDFVLIGNGLAPLVAARQLLAEGLRPLVLNLDDDFFREDSELPFDPIGLGEQGAPPARIRDALGENLMQDLGPLFPGSLQHWNSLRPAAGKANDPFAPYVRSRGWLWLVEENWRPARPIFLPEEAYVEASDAGIPSQWIEGPVAYRQIPGVSTQWLAEVLQRESLPAQALSIQGLADFDIDRFRQGLLEFVRERLGPTGLVSSAGAVELVEEGVRFATPEGARVVAPTRGVLAFWSPRLAPWLSAQAKQQNLNMPRPRGFRTWEQWKLVSRDPVDPSWVAVAGDCVLWAETEGDPGRRPCFRLSILRDAGFHGDESQAFNRGASTESFSALESVCRGLLGWEGLTVRSLRIRLLPEWDAPGLTPPSSWGKKRDLQIRVMTGCEGPGATVVRQTVRAVQGLLKGSA